MEPIQPASEYPVMLLHLAAEGATVTVYGRADDGDPRVHKKAAEYYLEDEENIYYAAEEWASFDLFWLSFKSKYHRWYRLFPLFIYDRIKPIVDQSVTELKRIRPRTPQLANAVHEWEAILTQS